MKDQIEALKKEVKSNYSAITQKAYLEILNLIVEDPKLWRQAADILREDGNKRNFAHWALVEFTKQHPEKLDFAIKFLCAENYPPTHVLNGVAKNFPEQTGKILRTLTKRALKTDNKHERYELVGTIASIAYDSDSKDRDLAIQLLSRIARAEPGNMNRIGGSLRHLVYISPDKAPEVVKAMVRVHSVEAGEELANMARASDRLEVSAAAVSGLVDLRRHFLKAAASGDEATSEKANKIASKIMRYGRETMGHSYRLCEANAEGLAILRQAFVKVGRAMPELKDLPALLDSVVATHEAKTRYDEMKRGDDVSYHRMFRSEMPMLSQRPNWVGHASTSHFMHHGR